MTRRSRLGSFVSAVRRPLAVLGLAVLALQLFFALRVALMAVVDPQSTAFERSEIWRLARTKPRLTWSQTWRDDSQIATTLKRAVIAAEDSDFIDHGGIDWDAIEAAWERNQRAQAVDAAPGRGSRLVGGSTITQQLAKNLFLSSERSLLRKLQEVPITYLLEATLSKPRILTIYLNHVEWGEGVFGAQAAAQRYFHADATQLGPPAAARLAVMLPAPKRYERRFESSYLRGRAAVVAARMGAVELP